MKGTVEELYWIGLWIILSVGLAGVITVILEYMVGRWK